MPPPSQGPGGGIFNAEVVQELEVDEAGEGLVELEECEHDTVVHLWREDLTEVVGREEGDGLAVDFRLEIEAFNGDEGLAEGVREANVGLELEEEAAC